MAQPASHIENQEDFGDFDLDEYRRRVYGSDIPLAHRHSTPYRIMAVGTESFLHLARPLAPAVIGVQPTTAPLNVIVQPQV